MSWQRLLRYASRVAVNTTPPRLQWRCGELGGPHRSLYVRLDSASRWKFSLGGFPVERHTSVACSAGGNGKRLSIAFSPPCSGVSKSPITTGPAPVSMVTSSSSTAPREAELYPELRESESAKPRFVLTRTTSRTLPETPPRIVEIVAAGTTIGPAVGVASSVSVGLLPVFWKISKKFAPAPNTLTTSENRRRCLSYTGRVTPSE